MKKIIFTVVLFSFVALFCFNVFAHSGGTDSKGGHYDHYNNEYHYHHGHPAHQHEDGSCPYVTKSDTNESDEKNISFFGLIVISIFVSWIGGSLLFAISFWILKLFFNDFFEKHFTAIHWICSVIVGIVFFIYGFYHII